MKLFSRLVGHVFYDLLQYGREIERVIARKDESLIQHSTPDLERYFARVPSELPRQNAFPVAFLLLFLLVAFSLNILTFLKFLPHMSPPAHALSFFVPSLIMIALVLTAGFLQARGYTAGITVFFWVFIALVASTVALGVGNLIFRASPLWPLLVACFALVGSRVILNSRAFVLFTLYCRTQRIAVLARNMRVKPRQA